MAKGGSTGEDENMWQRQQNSRWSLKTELLKPHAATPLLQKHIMKPFRLFPEDVSRLRSKPPPQSHLFGDATGGLCAESICKF